MAAMTQPALPTPASTLFYRHDDADPLAVRLRRGATRRWWRCDSIGKSHEGRDIWVATVTNIATGAAADKPAFWADGNIHAAELTAEHRGACTTCTSCVSGYGGDARRHARCSTRARVYLCPRLNPDGAELALADRPRHIRSSTRRYPFDEEPVEGLTRRGRRRRRPRAVHAHRPIRTARYKKCDADPRLMVRARARRVRRRVLPR